MNLSTRQSRRAWITFAAFPLAWGVLVAMDLHVRYRDPFGPSLMHPGYGENLPGDLASTLIWGACEISVLLLILWPWMQQWLRARLVAALVLYVPWSLFVGMVTMHAGSISASLVVWRVGIILLLLVLLLGLVVRSGFRRVAAG